MVLRLERVIDRAGSDDAESNEQGERDRQVATQRCDDDDDDTMMR